VRAVRAYVTEHMELIAAELIPALG